MANERDEDRLGEDQETSQSTSGTQAADPGSKQTTSGQTSGSDGQPIGGNDSRTGSGTTTSQGAQFGQGSTGNEFGQSKGESAFGESAVSGGGQSDLGTQADTTLAGRADQQDLGTDQPGSAGSGRQPETGEGFIGQQGGGSDEYLQERGDSAGGTTTPSGTGATGGSDFANQGRGALDEEEEDESGTGSTGGGGQI